jgi:O-6-methylguanine DNA methyltransferase
MENLYYGHMESPVGTLTVVASDMGLTHVFFPRKGRPAGESFLRKELPGYRILLDPIRIAEYTRQLEEYFASKRISFSIPLDLRGTAFQKKVWSALLGVPYGHTESYGNIAKKLRRPGAARAVGAACGANPAAIVVPCHRIVAVDGALTGFGGGLGVKERLLALEHEALEGSSAGR